MEKEFNQVEDFLEEATFREWVFNQDNNRNLFWEAWCKNHPAKCEMLQEAREILLSIENEVTEWEQVRQDRMMDDINQILDKEASETGKKITLPLSKKDGPSWRNAAVIFLTMGLGFILLWQLNLIIPSNQNVQEEDNSSGWIANSTNPGEKKRVKLPDGTVVTMNSSSTIHYQDGFGKSNRNLYLEGESYFEVAKDPKLPFIVISGKLKTIALGTAFTIKSFPNENLSQVRLIEGSVSVESENLKEIGNDLIFLVPGEEAALSNSELKKSRFNPGTALLWTEGVLFFDNVPFQKAMLELERWYGVQITVQGNLERAHMISGEFKQDNLNNVLKSLSYTFGFKFHLDEKKVNVQF